ncbi:hypothetical protein TIFTF001_008008 [Ficus carica]|uniref:Uncharacterized protein n=1 Tax=Ficus carica TaxID=3494 RepID=A0AA88AEB7_FICCA|nr:hypothetical protein TIFTF001_008008 [Ficus carica]
MRNKFGSLLGRSLKTSKFKPLVSLAISRLAVLKNQRQVRFSQARSDVLQLLQLGNHDRALLRVEHVIKEQNMLDVYDMIEKYCNLLIERTHLIEHERCGDFPELHEIRAILTSHFGKEFAARAVELRNNCGVNLTMIQKLSTRQPILENRMTVLKEIAAENSIVLQLEEAAFFSTQEKTDVQKNQHQPAPKTGLHILPEDLEDGKFSGKYKDVADAAQAAFESAAFAAAAARAAVELSRFGHDSDSQDSPGSRQGKSADRNEPMKLESELEEEKIPVENQTVRLKRSFSSSSSDDMNQANPSGKDVVFDDSDSETVDVKNNTSASDMKIPPRFQAGLKADSIQHSREKEAAGSEGESEPRLNLEKGPFSVRTWRLRG